MGRVVRTVPSGRADRRRDRLPTTPGRIKVGKVDVDAEPGLAARFNALSIPTIVLVKNGEVVASAIGARPKAALVEALELEQHAAAVA